MKEQRIQLLVALVGLAAASFIFHYKMHPPEQFLSHFWASLFSAMDVILVTILFLSRSTAIWGLLLNSFLSFLGIIMMTDLAIVSSLEGWIKVSLFRQPIAWLMESTFPDILIVIADFTIGLTLYRIT
ncbi:MAG: hypothetical protein HY912_24480, partial [Desulfomonile tiedjei]|nr:hypothetical protein [Desulfomonile tiedjei]